VSLRLNIFITAANGEFTGTTVNISMGGVYVAVNRRMNVSVDDRLLITIPLVCDSPEKSIQVTGMVVRVEEGGIAVKFQEMDRLTFHTLLAMVNHQAG
jgi:PilZ domain